MEIKINIEKCDSCIHRTHSGGFTVRGARPICGHPEACKIRRSKNAFKKEYPEYRTECKTADWKYHWFHRIIDPNTIPDWCPIKHGAKY